jgi:uncharacterized surface protein with fasciclin (FAS1) repeats
MAGQDGTNQDQTVDPGIDDKLQTHTMSETLAKLKECSLFYEMIDKAGLHGALGHSGLYTLLAPNNAALGKNTPGDPRQFLEQHVLSGAMRSDDLQGLQNVKTVAGTTLPVTVQGTSIRLGNAAVQRADIQCTNGVIHVIGANLSESGA